MTDKLLHCPFCGSNDVIESVGKNGDGTDWFFIECLGCAALAEVDMWNKRQAVREAVPEALRKEAGVLAGAKLREKHADIRHYLQEAHGFASMSPRGKEDIATALEILDELEAEVLSLIAAAKEADK